MAILQKLNLAQLKDGLLIELTDKAIEEIRADFQDKLKDPVAVRKLMIEMSFIPDEDDSTEMGIVLKIATKLAPIVVSGGRVKLGHVEGELGFFQELFEPEIDGTVRKIR